MEAKVLHAKPASTITHLQHEVIIRAGSLNLDLDSDGHCQGQDAAPDNDQGGVLVC